MAEPRVLACQKPECIWQGQAQDLVRVEQASIVSWQLVQLGALARNVRLTLALGAPLSIVQVHLAIGVFDPVDANQQAPKDLVQLREA